MRHRRTIIFGVALAVAIATGALAGTIPETLVEGGGGNQFSGDGNTTYLTWAANSTAHPRHYDSLTRLLAGGASTKMNDPGTQGYAGDINGDGTEAVFQETDGAASDIFLYDLAGHTSTPAPVAVNTNLWEWAPSVSDGYILFGRNKFARPSSPWKIVLYDRNADTTTVLATGTNECRCIFPGQVSDDYATWSTCAGRTCQSWYYDIAGETSARIPNPLDKEQYFPGVSAATGDIYFIRSGFACGQNVKVVRWNPVAGGDAVVVSAQPAGYDVYLGPNVFDDAGDHQDVYVDRQICSGKYYADIYVVNDADTATFTRQVAGRSSRSGQARRLVVPGSSPQR